ncbi:MAG TPA: TrbC/VirB2 family protein [Acidobacteriaceae bacterium]|jgi:type IV secretion system protein VirB2|nr:TrbC/VirB2 family protein [Acidobacteriaceae bacterium]
MTAEHLPPEVPMNSLLHPSEQRSIAIRRRLRHIRQSITLFLLLALFPALAIAQSGSPFDTGLTSLQNLFTGTIAKVASLIAIVIGGYQFAHGEPGAKKTLAGVAAGTGIAVMAVNVLSWLWGI